MSSQDDRGSLTDLVSFLVLIFCLPYFYKCKDFKTYLFVSVRLPFSLSTHLSRKFSHGSHHKSWLFWSNWWRMHSNLAYIIVVTRPLPPDHTVNLTSDLIQGQVSKPCRGTIIWPCYWQCIMCILDVHIIPLAATILPMLKFIPSVHIPWPSILYSLVVITKAICLCQNHDFYLYMCYIKIFKFCILKSSITVFMYSLN